MLRIHLLQYGSKIGDVEYNLNRLIKAMERLCVGDGADLIVAPELYLPGYMSKDLIFQIAEPIGGRTISRLLMEASRRNCHVIVGFAERSENTPCSLQYGGGHRLTGGYWQCIGRDICILRNF